MMGDLIPFESGCELAPLSAPDLQPADAWQVPAPDFITEHQYSEGTPTFFGCRSMVLRCSKRNTLSAKWRRFSKGTWRSTGLMAGWWTPP